jgi:hypothetical protein
MEKLAEKVIKKELDVFKLKEIISRLNQINRIKDEIEGIKKLRNIPSGTPIDDKNIFDVINVLHK